jgi:hypothetical protein
VVTSRQSDVRGIAQQIASRTIEAINSGENGELPQIGDNDSANSSQRDAEKGQSGAQGGQHSTDAKQFMALNASIRNGIFKGFLVLILMPRRGSPESSGHCSIASIL